MITKWKNTRWLVAPTLLLNWYSGHSRCVWTIRIFWSSHIFRTLKFYTARSTPKPQWSVEKTSPMPQEGRAPFVAQEWAVPLASLYRKVGGGLCLSAHEGLDRKARLSQRRAQTWDNIRLKIFFYSATIFAYWKYRGLMMRLALASDIGIQRFQTMYLATLDQGGQRPIHSWRCDFWVNVLKAFEQTICRMWAITSTQNCKHCRLHFLSPLAHTVLHNNSIQY